MRMSKEEWEFESQMIDAENAEMDRQYADEQWRRIEYERFIEECHPELSLTPRVKL